MEVNNAIVPLQDGCGSHPVAMEAPPVVKRDKRNSDQSGAGNANAKKKHRRGKSKRKITKSYMKMIWRQPRTNAERSNKVNRTRKLLPLKKTQAPFNNNQFLMEIHKPEPGNNFQGARSPSARTRDSSFSIDSDENYFLSLPEDEEEFLTKEFSSVYEDAQIERLANMTKTDLVQEYLILESKYESIAKRNDKSGVCPTVGDSTQTIEDLLAKLKDRDMEIRELKASNEKLRQQNERMQHSSCSSSEDSESDSSTSSSSSRSSYGHYNQVTSGLVNGNDHIEVSLSETISDQRQEVPIALRNGNATTENGVAHQD